MSAASPQRQGVEEARGRTYPEGSTVGKADGQIGEDGEQAIGHRRLEGQVVGDLVDGEKEILVGSGSKDVGDGPELEREERGVAEEVGEEDLEGDNAGDDVLGQGLGAAELGDLSTCASVLRPAGLGAKSAASSIPYLWMCLDDGKPPCAVRLFCVCPKEVPILLLHGLAFRGADAAVELDTRAGVAIGGVRFPLGRGIGDCRGRGRHLDVWLAQ